MTFDCQYARHRMSPPRMGGGSGGGRVGWGGEGWYESIFNTFLRTDATTP